MAMFNLTMLTALGYICFTAYQNGVYEPSKLMELVKIEMESFAFGNESFSSLFTWDDIFVKLFVVKIVTVIMLLLIMNTTRFIE